jgi:hypothetical protein
MILLLAFCSVLFAIVATFYLQIPTFILALGYGWSHNYKRKRWVWRLLALATLLCFIAVNPPLWLLWTTVMPFSFLWIFSLFNANPNLFIALQENNLDRKMGLLYPKETEMVGHVIASGEAICYPVQEMIMPRHIINDTFNGSPVLVSYCAACRSTMLYNPVVSGLRLNFEVIGVRRRNMIIRDLETGTIWQQGTGEAMYGQLKGAKMDFLYYQQMALIDWLQLYPNSMVVQEKDNVRKAIVPKKRLMKVLKKATENFVAPGNSDLSGLPLREKIWGVELNGFSKAYPISRLKNRSKFQDQIGQTPVSIEYNSASNQINGVVLATNEPLHFQHHWWFGWKEFHADTEVFG